ncbi:MAG TPA: hypothetical protein VGL01_04740 [Trinickia sp.]
MSGLATRVVIPLPRSIESPGTTSARLDPCVHH